MELLINFLNTLNILLLVYLGFSAVYFLLFAVLAIFYKEKKVVKSLSGYKISVLIPAYKEDYVIIETARSATQHISQKADIDVLIIADKLKKETIKKIKSEGAGVLEVNFKNSTKSKSIREALKVIDKDTDMIVVLDADNIMQDHFIDEIVLQMEQGYKIVQGHRIAKNRNTNFAVLDGVSEEINNSIFRKGHRTVKLSSSIIGSGFVCDYNLFNDLLNSAKSVGGFDKELELMILGKRIKIGYAQNAYVLDEKIQQADAFMNQRRRWLSAQFVYFTKNTINGFIQLITKGNIDYFDKLIQFLVLPRILTLGMVGIITLLHIVLFALIKETGVLNFLTLWLVALTTTVAALLIAIPKKLYNKRTMKALLSLPKGFLLTFAALLKIRGANKSFIHTTHGSNQVS